MSKVLKWNSDLQKKLHGKKIQNKKKKLKNSKRVQSGMTHSPRVKVTKIKSLFTKKVLKIFLNISLQMNCS